MSRTSLPPDLKLFRGSGDAGTYVWSPFVTKVEARLRFDGLRYTSGHGSPRSAPRGKIPYMEWHETTSAGDDAVSAMGDSALIIRALVANGLLRDLNAALPTGALRAQDLAVRALLEDRVYFYGTREKWCDNYDEMVENMLAAVPWPVRAVVGWMAQRATVRTLHGQGTGRLSDDEVLMFKEEVWEGVEALLAEAKKKRTTGGDDAPFWVLGEEEPSEADATLFGFIIGGLVSTAAPVTQAIVSKLPHVIEYAERIHDTYFPDYEKWK
ncbi:hypothetical protein LMH87_006503 [Akanthomyces muscarius]|uniref:Thioredoxin-like fold domain-containing protein n=1 Tax=Akanthomyces muscarius TaxID=2231603 RepID=A0A9W8QNX2_AKAMU|nr:hypothetical protein LMH87_006503 [Akanthomyces muscarius]KAJ4164848.1 hypothetical protein LMH87_006503 [Akanthomyces muscarius]